ncbi:hypothetical protein BOSE62_71539 [Bosea sp. 62]|nr:hypothetical protein BOSE21B_90077 [Bosea sp. 21B]CAD5293720.1 hypothetical protein BOSE46_80186 [Bosea sp. 46]CAD5299430.1 hypothetical protein BOSE7B_60588 [Bosea sp. 7B]VVT62193.1 hypothetical protein BOS5A_30054 [Bosea sp. EC-HK365B]VXB44224.1 hypothetical protein BOSE127_120052 [Bosea sp. 127]VXC72629.1 hypothetical protein BOSE29B_80074 [Bosea sp. 29B]VXC93329.1 hypothetical protein BOSE62_71539 [Bosea sp. 62]
MTGLIYMQAVPHRHERIARQRYGHAVQFDTEPGLIGRLDCRHRAGGDRPPPQFLSDCHPLLAGCGVARLKGRFQEAENRNERTATLVRKPILQIRALGQQFTLFPHQLIALQFDPTQRRDGHGDHVLQFSEHFLTRAPNPPRRVFRGHSP